MNYINSLKKKDMLFKCKKIIIIIIFFYRMISSKWKFFTFFFFLSFSLNYGSNILNVEVDPSSLTAHHTQAYRFETLGANDTKPVIVRRGFTFAFFVKVSESTTEQVRIETVPKALTLTVSSSTFDQGSLTFHVVLSTTELEKIGRFNLSFSLDNTVSFGESLIILFNPYNSVDQVFYPNQEELSEYIENENGIHWRGGAEWHYPSRWYYAQFSYYSLLTALYALDNFEGDSSDPITVSRYFTQFATIQGGGPGLLWGRWSEPYSGGQLPTSWTGTNQIVEQFIKTNYQTVKYAQCWVFGGSINTLMRTLGIASRQLFTFGSGHESPVGGHYSHVIENKYDERGSYIGSSGGSVWNFHSWNEIWLNSRSDGVDNGWQAIDGTPQERSDGAYRMGPTSVTAVKERKETLPYDVPFVVSEVDATLVNNMYKCQSGRFNCQFLKHISNTTSGDLIVTQLPGSTEEADITWNYKVKHQPNDTLRTILRSSFNTMNNKVNNEIEKVIRHNRRQMEDRLGNNLRVEVSFPQLDYGKDIQSVVKVTRLSTSSRIEKVLLRAQILKVDGRGVVLAELKSFTRSIYLNEGQSVETELIELQVEEYAKLVGDSQLRFSFFFSSEGEVESKKNHLVLDRLVQLRVPSLSLKIHEVVTGRKFIKTSLSNNPFASFKLTTNHHRLSSPSSSIVEVEYSFENPLPFDLKNVHFVVNSGRLMNNQKEGGLVIEKIKANASFKGQVQVVIRNGELKNNNHVGTSQQLFPIIVSMTSDLLSSHGFIDLSA